MRGGCRDKPRQVIANKICNILFSDTSMGILAVQVKLTSVCPSLGQTSYRKKRYKKCIAHMPVNTLIVSIVRRRHLVRRAYTIKVWLLASKLPSGGIIGIILTLSI